ncbi:hypothetical protein B0T10DRAFT_480691 [Thelonectria olida]|uniref:Uncharacterized protein n=1 Tax=Thelonectria olida TaxID=1576542 RepID=A0A9P8WBL3_9HYPO|nr:hypothetical protein B0T10DRAFT_480691 [Thelonectria olida]
MPLTYTHRREAIVNPSIRVRYLCPTLLWILLFAVILDIGVWTMSFYAIEAATPDPDSHFKAVQAMIITLVRPVFTFLMWMLHLTCYAAHLRD